MDEMINVPAEKVITEWYSVKGFRTGLKKYENQYLPNACKDISCIRNMKVRSDDVYVIGFPKSGTTWIEDICWLLLHNLDYEEFKKSSHLSRVPFLDFEIKNEILEVRSSPRIFKSHFTLDILPENIDKTSKIVYCVRNPKDCMVSGYHFLKHLQVTSLLALLKSIVKHFLKEKNTVDRIKDLAKFIEKEYSDEDVKTVALFTTFDNLKQISIPFVQEIKEMLYASDDFEFFRRGQIGNWYTIFTPEISKRFDEVISKKLKYKGEFVYGNPPDEWKKI